MCRRVFIVSIVLCVLALGSVPVWGQITITAEDGAPKMGVKTEYSLVTVEGSMEDALLPIGEEGGPHTWDVSALDPLLFNLVTGTLVSSILPPHMAPMAGDFPDADYVLHMEVAISLFTGEEEKGDYYFFMKRGSAVDVVLGSTDPNMPVPPGYLPEDIGLYPLSLGKAWSVTLSPGSVAGTVGPSEMQLHADAWGTAITDAGEFEVLRLAQHFEGTIRLGEAEGTIEAPLVIEVYQWMAKEVEMVAAVQETHIGPVEGVPELSEEIVQTEVFRLTALSEIDVETSVQAMTWGQVKKILDGPTFREDTPQSIE